jgi:site-specific DNA-methyltransferase (adenine-specific)/modification methylase
MEAITDRISIHLGDCYELLDSWPSDAAIITDPPYGISYQHSGRTGCKGRWSRGDNRAVVGDNTPFDPAPFSRFNWVLLWGADHFRSRLPDGGTMLAWNKIGTHEFSDSFVDCEFAWCNAKVKRNVCNLLWKGICGMSGEERKRRHPTQKPVALCSWCLTTLKLPADTLVIDPFMGSGSFGLACHRAGLRYIGVEIVADHYATARERLLRETEQGFLDFDNTRRDARREQEET